MALVPKFSLSDLQQGQPIVDTKGNPSDVLLRNINGNVAALRKTLQAISNILEQIVELNGLVVAQGNEVTATRRELARINSYTEPTSVLTAEDAGSDASITIINFRRVYPVQGAYDVPDVDITGATLTGLDYSTFYAVYYDDTTLADTTPNFMTTTEINTAQFGAAPGRHFVGTVTTPGPGGPPSGGTGGSPPGGGGGGLDAPLP